VRGLSRRIAEATRLGYQTILVPPDSVTAPANGGASGASRSSGGVHVREAATLGAALVALLG
jgi:predicted ATP-dependent serine protease